MPTPTNSGWTPLGWSQEEGEHYGVLIDGIPEWLVTSIQGWITSRFILRGAHHYPSGSDSFFNLPLLRQFERKCHIAIPFNTDGTGLAIVRSGVLTTYTTTASQDKVLQLIDFLLVDATFDSAEKLDAILLEGGSAYKVGRRGESLGLLKRVPQGVQDQVDRIIRDSGTAGRLLSEAWAKAYGVDPDPSVAYSLAVKAAEAAICHQVEPNNTNATLGTSLGQLRNDRDWSLLISQNRVNDVVSQLPIMVAGALWRGQTDRHGHPDYSGASQVDAEIAISLASNLVQWFSSAQVSRP